MKKLLLLSGLLLSLNCYGEPQPDITPAQAAYILATYDNSLQNLCYKYLGHSHECRNVIARGLSLWVNSTNALDKDAAEDAPDNVTIVHDKTNKESYNILKMACLYARDYLDDPETEEDNCNFDILSAIAAVLQWNHDNQLKANKKAKVINKAK